MKAILTFAILLSVFTAAAQVPINTKPRVPATIPKAPPKVPPTIHIIPQTSALYERTYAFHIDGDYLDVWIDNANVLHFNSNKNIDKQSITTYANKSAWIAKKGNEHIINGGPVKYNDISLGTPEYRHNYAYVVTLHMVGAGTNYQTIFVK